MSEFAARVRARTAIDEGTDGRVPVLELVGQLDGSAAVAMQHGYAEATTPRPPAIVLDFAGVTYINSTGIALVVGLLGSARADEVDVRVLGLSDHYRHIFEITRLADFMTFFDDEVSAIASPQPS